jgi:hypothetical protein
VDLGDHAPVAVEVYGQWHWLLTRTVDTPPTPPAKLSGGVVSWGLSVAARF